MEALCVNTGGITFIGKGGTNHWVVMDGPPIFKGYEAGTHPFELVFIGLGGCTGMDVVSLLQKKRIKYERFEIKLKVERASEHPKVAERIELEYLFYGKGIDPKQVEEAIRLSQEKYCSVSAMLRKAAPMNWSYKIIDS
jgi:putative redox protein